MLYLKLYAINKSLYLFKMTEAAKQLANKIFDSGSINDTCLRACEMALEAQNFPQKDSAHSLTVALILSELNLDHITLIATLISDSRLETCYSIEQIEEEFGDQIANLVKNIRKLNSFKIFHSDIESNEVQNERLRQMLLAMTSDIRAMVVKLAYRVARLRSIKNEPDDIKHKIATETQLIFAPLANRLGMAQLKWELEDLSFRFLHPSDYKEIAKTLATKRADREGYIQDLLQTFKNLIDKSNISYQISGRPKHLYSIWKKMTRKALPIDELYDLRAVRIYVDTIQQCYEVLGLIHSNWSYVKNEFDDYIATPKENGYQSIHTVIYGPQNHTVEIQIRTHEMHYTSEYGVAAHWRYKEDNQQVDARLEKSIDLVRQILEYNDDPDLLNKISTELLSEHIYVVSKNNEIITLSQGTTALDFAYQIHTDIGHKCRGSKINGKIMPLTTKLNTGDKVEILTLKNATPNRNWLNPNLGFLSSPKSRSKVRHWFNLQNKETNIASGETLFNKEVKRLNAIKLDIQPILERFRVNNEESLFEAIGKGQINERQLTSTIQKQIEIIKLPIEKSADVKSLIPHNAKQTSDSFEHQAYVVGASQIRTNLAPCCYPKNNDDIVGYVTRGRGVTIHQSNCLNILNLTHEETQRIIQVDWCQNIEKPLYHAKIKITGFNRKGLLRDIMNCLLEQDINLTSSSTKTNNTDGIATINLGVEIENNHAIGSILDKLELIQNIESASIQE